MFFWHRSKHRASSKCTPPQGNMAAFAALGRTDAIRERQRAAARASGSIWCAPSAYSGTYLQQEYNAQLRRERVSAAGAALAEEPLPTANTHHPADGVATPPLRPGMEIKLVPLVKYDASSSMNSECGICFEAFGPDDQLRVPSCGHGCHARCLRLWFARGGPCCPTCRLTVSIPSQPSSPAIAAGGTIASRIREEEEAAAQAAAARAMGGGQRPRSPLYAKLLRSLRGGSNAADSSRPSRPPRTRSDPSVFLDEYYP